jgi:hypothetical protein
MSFYASAGRIRATDAAGNVIFDTDERLFTVTDGPLTGTVATNGGSDRSFAFSSTGTAQYHVTADTVISSVNAAATVVRGAFQSTVVGSNTGIANKGWFNASGSYVATMYATGPALGGLNNVTLNSFVTFTFMISGGNLILRERYRVCTPLPSSSPTVIVRSHSLQYHLFCGAFV